MKFDIEKYTGNYVMHCKTEEEARDFCKYLDGIGRRWSSGISYIDNSHWHDYGPDTIYWFNLGRYDYVRNDTDATILEWSDFMNKEEPTRWNKLNTDHSKEVFELLGVSPEEIFRIGNICSADYKITQDLKVYINHDRDYWTKSTLTIADFLSGRVVICKKRILTEMEQLAIDYALACDCHWLAKDQDEAIYAYKEKPEKRFAEWSYANNHTKGDFIEIGLPISFLSWEDDEPFHIIGD
jgi:hypothetical protein